MVTATVNRVSTSRVSISPTITVDAAMAIPEISLDQAFVTLETEQLMCGGATRGAPIGSTAAGGASESVKWNAPEKTSTKTDRDERMRGQE